MRPAFRTSVHGENILITVEGPDLFRWAQLDPSGGHIRTGSARLSGHVLILDRSGVAVRPNDGSLRRLNHLPNWSATPYVDWTSVSSTHRGSPDPEICRVLKQMT